MKKILCVVAALSLLLSLVACAPDPEEQALQQIRTLLDEGKYQEAEEALQSLESYQTIMELQEEARDGITEQIAQEALAVLSSYGIAPGSAWVDLSLGSRLTFRNVDGPSGSAERHVWEQGAEMLWNDVYWEVIDGALYIHWNTVTVDGYVSPYDVPPEKEGPDGLVPVTALERDGVPHLLIGQFDFIPEETFREQVTRVEITQENWQEYLEVKTLLTWEESPEDPESGCREQTALCLKEPYAGRLIRGMSLLSVDYSYEQVYRMVDSVDHGGRILRLGEETSRYEREGSAITADTYFASEFLSAFTDPLLELCGSNHFYTHYEDRGKEVTIHQFAQCEGMTVNSIGGVLVLRPE